MATKGHSAAKPEQKTKEANRRIRGKAIFALGQTICAGSEKFFGMEVSWRLANMLLGLAVQGTPAALPAPTEDNQSN